MEDAMSWILLLVIVLASAAIMLIAMRQDSQAAARSRMIARANAAAIREFENEEA